MRRPSLRAVLLIVVAAMLLGALFACGPDEGYKFGQKEYTAKVGETVALKPQRYDNQNHGCQCDPPDMVYLEARNVDYGIEPAEGAKVSSKGIFQASKPGTYVVTMYGTLGSASTTVKVTGDEDDVALAEDDDESADGTTSEGDVAAADDTSGEPVEVFGTHSLGAVNTGNPPNPTVFTLEKKTKITSIMTYHWNDGQGSAGGGKIGLVAEGGKKYGPWKLTKTTDGQGGVPNAYWYVEPDDLELPPGTYTVTDTDPATWSWNDETGGMGVVIIYGIPER
ncbi:MAG: hypothetical protein EG823_07155 [Actinobacteria bacterium]|nr:hypothetical protein [Actinomycetota bacterium]